MHVFYYKHPLDKLYSLYSRAQNLGLISQGNGLITRHTLSPFCPMNNFNRKGRETSLQFKVRKSLGKLGFTAHQIGENPACFSTS